MGGPHAGLSHKRTASTLPGNGKKACLARPAEVPGNALGRVSMTGSQVLCRVVHQFGLVGGSAYDSKRKRLQQILERMPADSSPVVVLAESASISAAQAIADAHNAMHVFEVLVQENEDGMPLATRHVINYDLPTSKEYLSRAALIAQRAGAGVVYTFLQEEQLSGPSCRDIAGLLQRAHRAQLRVGDLAKAAELDSALQQLSKDSDQETGDDGDEEADDNQACDCIHCTGCSIGGTTYHSGAPGRLRGRPARVEVVRVPLHGLEDLDCLAPLIAPRLPDHVCTVICLHNLNCHTPWDGHEHLFALPEGMGAVRVVMVLADNASWHDYPDVGSFSAGVAWMDVLDAASMERTDALIRSLVDHEVALLDYQSDRLFLMGMSQGGAQSMLRFLRSRRQLGGWVGCVCHAPTAPHIPRCADPLTGVGRATVNLGQPMRLLIGEVDTVFPAPLVLRDVERLRVVGGFTNVEVDVRPGLRHEGFADDLEAEERGEEVKSGPPVELLYLQQVWPSLLSHIRSPKSPVSQ